MIYFHGIMELSLF